MNPYVTVPLRRIARFAYGDSLAAEVRREGDVPVFGSNGPVGVHDTPNTLAPAIVIGRKGSFGKVQFSSTPVFAIDTTYFVESRYTATDLRWLFYALSSMGLDGLSQDVGVPGLARETAYPLPVPLPPRKRQVEIADYLDAETTRIDGIVALRQRQIELLGEARAQIVSGLTSGRAGKLPHIVWLPTPPQSLLVAAGPGIDMTRFGGLFVRIDKRGRGVDLPLMSVSQMRGVVRRSELTADLPRADSLDDYKVCRTGDIVFNKMSIRDGAMGVAHEDGLVTYHYEVMRPRPDVDSRYVVYLMKSDWFTGELIRNERGIGAGGTSGVRTTEVPFSVLRTIEAPIADPGRQRAVADYLDEATARIDGLRSSIERQVALLGERRRALITATVTGQFDIPGVAA